MGSKGLKIRLYGSSLIMPEGIYIFYMQVNGTLSEVNMRSGLKAKVQRTFGGQSVLAVRAAHACVLTNCGGGPRGSICLAVFGAASEHF